MTKVHLQTHKHSETAVIYIPSSTLHLLMAGGKTLSPYNIPHCPLLSGLCLKQPARTVREQTHYLTGSICCLHVSVCYL